MKSRPLTDLPGDLQAGETQITTATCSHCGGTCLLKVHVDGGVISRIEAGDGPEPQPRPCLRCRAYRQRIYSRDRVLHPMARTGQRGEGKFKKISWDEALNTVADGLKRVRDTYGPAAILSMGLGGDSTIYNSYKALDRLLCKFGGHTKTWGWLSFQGATYASVATYGTINTGNDRADMLNSRLVIMWGWDPATTIQSTGTSWYIACAREKGIKVVAIDPRCTDSAAVLSDSWIPIRPGMDAAMAIAMAYVIDGEGLQDRKFLDKYTVGYGEYKNYLRGAEDGVPKTPGWAESITGVPASTIAALAREYATLKPACLMSGIGPGRTAYGEQFHRATMVLAAMTGNVGIHGGEAAARAHRENMPFNQYPFNTTPSMRSGPNSVEANAPDRPLSLKNYPMSPTAARIHYAKLGDAMLKGKAGGYPADLKALYVMTKEPLNQLPDSNKIARGLQKLDFIVVHSQALTPISQYADILLPASTWMERNDITAAGASPAIFFLKKVVDPLGESKTHIEILNALASRLGIRDYNDKSEEEWLRQIAGKSEAGDYESLRKNSIFKIPLSEPYVAFKAQVEDPENNPFPTPSGKIEIYSEELAGMNNPLLPPIPKFIEPWEGPNDPLAARYPLQLITSHFKRRTHTQFEDVPWLRELMPQAAWINSLDAEKRAIRDGDRVRVFNDRGQTVLLAKVTPRIMPGVIDVPQGAWYSPDGNGLDREGCANVLTRDDYSPAGALATNTALVQVERFEGD